MGEEGPGSVQPTCLGSQRRRTLVTLVGAAAGPCSYCVYFLLQQLDSIHVTILHKEDGAGLGFSLAGGADLENKVITVSGPATGPDGGGTPGGW